MTGEPVGGLPSAGTRTAGDRELIAQGQIVSLLAAALRSAHESSGLSMDAILLRWEREAESAFADIDAFAAILKHAVPPSHGASATADANPDPGPVV